MKPCRLACTACSFIGILCLVSLVPRLEGQSTSGRIVGNVRDTSGGVVPGARVTLRNERSGENYSRVTDSLGAYEFSNLIPGLYELQGEASGFRPVAVKGITLQVDQTARFDLSVEVGQTSDTVSVNASAPVLSEDTSDIGQVINTRQIEELPLNGRNFLQLAALTNGVVLVQANGGGNSESGGPQFISEGNRVQQNSFLINGVESRIQREGNYGINLSVDAIQEFKILQNNFSAEYGRASAIVDTVIKSGTNAVHGTLFEFLRNDKLDARNAFDFTGAKPPLRLNQFGGSVGGPIKRDKLFYFVDYEGQRVAQSTTQSALVPTSAQLSGNLAGLPSAIDPQTLTAFPGNQIPASRISQFAQQASKLFLSPNAVLSSGNNFIGLVPNPTTMNQGVARIDYLLRDSDRIAGHFVNFRYDNASGSLFPESGTQGYSHATNLSAQWIHTFSPSLINVFRFGYAHTNTFLGPNLLTADVTKAYGLQNLTPDSSEYAPPYVTLSGYATTGGYYFSPNGSTDINRQFDEQIAFTKGRHSLKFGTDLRFLRWNDLGYATANGWFNFSGAITGNVLADFLLGIPYYAYADIKGTGTSAGTGFPFATTNGESSFYAQDDIRVNSTLTVNIGLRYEFVQWPKEDHNEFAIWNFKTNTRDYACKGAPCRLANPDWNDWGPRLGFAWSPKFLPKTVIRAGSGITYGNFRQWEYSPFHLTPPYDYEQYFGNYSGPGAVQYTTANLFPAAPSNPDISGEFNNSPAPYQNPNKKLPRQYQWNFGIQHELLPNLLFEVRYTGNRGVHQPVRVDANAPLCPGCARPDSLVGSVGSWEWYGTSTYNALDVRIEKRYSNGLTLLGTYSYSKSLGLNTQNNFTLLDTYNARVNYGPFNDNTHRAVISYVYDLPFGPGKRFLNSNRGLAGALVGGWQLNGITSIHSGDALTVYSNVDSGTDPIRVSNHANRIANGNLPGDKRTENMWFDTAAFVNPAFHTVGNSGEGVVRGPGYLNFDLSLFKNTKINERITAQFRAEAFNAFNNVNYFNPNTTVGAAQFGRISGAFSGRQIQLGLKLLF